MAYSFFRPLNNGVAMLQLISVNVAQWFGGIQCLSQHYVECTSVWEFDCGWVWYWCLAACFVDLSFGEWHSPSCILEGSSSSSNAVCGASVSCEMQVFVVISMSFLSPAKHNKFSLRKTWWGVSCFPWGRAHNRLGNTSVLLIPEK